MSQDTKRTFGPKSLKSGLGLLALGICLMAAAALWRGFGQGASAAPEVQAQTSEASAQDPSSDTTKDEETEGSKDSADHKMWSEKVVEDAMNDAFTIGSWDDAALVTDTLNEKYGMPKDCQAAREFFCEGTHGSIGGSMKVESCEVVADNLDSGHVVGVLTVKYTNNVTKAQGTAKAHILVEAKVAGDEKNPQIKDLVLMPAGN